jgi:hypothetical protein
MNKKDKIKKPKQPSEDNNKSKNTEIDSFIQEAKNSKFSYSILLSLLVCVVLSIYFQYQYEKSRRMSREDYSNDEIDYYEVMGLEANADLAETKRKYKELARVW